MPDSHDPADDADDADDADREITLIWWGEIDLDNAHQVREELVQALSGVARAVYVDLTGVTFIDSAGLGVLVSGWKRARSKDITLSISAPSGQVRRALELMGLLETLSPDTDAGPAA